MRYHCATPTIKKFLVNAELAGKLSHAPKTLGPTGLLRAFGEVSAVARLSRSFGTQGGFQ